MKKIVGIMAAASVLAASVFAADVSAKVNILGDLFNYNGGNIKALGIAEGGQGWNPSFQMSASGDNYGATMKFFDDGAQGNVSNVNYQIWFKPADMLKVTVGQWDTNLNQEHINWSNTATAVDSNGYVLSLDVAGVALDVALLPGWSKANFGWYRPGNVNGVFTKPEKGDAVLSEMYFKVAYGADFGKLSAYANLNAGNAKGANDFGIGYSNTFGGVNMFVNAIVGMQDSDFGIVRAEAYCEANAGPANIKAFVAGGYAGKTFNNIAADKDVAKTNGDVVAEKAYVGALANVGLPYGIYVKVWDGNFMADKFNMTVKPGITKNYGSCAIDAAIELNFADSVSVDVPVVFTVAF